MRVRAVDRLGEALLLFLVLLGGAGAFALLSGNPLFRLVGLRGAASPYGASLPGDGLLFTRSVAALLIGLGLLALGALLFPNRADRALSSFLRLWEGLEEDYLAYRIGQTAYIGNRLVEAGVPIIEPPGGHAIYINAGKLFSHIPQGEFPGLALSTALYLEGGVRACEIGSVMFAHPDPDSGEMVYPKLELVRLAIPRRMYTQSHFDYVIDTIVQVAADRMKYGGFGFTYAAPLMRHFTARFAPVGGKKKQ